MLTLNGCESAQTKAAHEIANALPRALGPARHYDVEVQGDPLSLTRGHVSRIHINGQEVRVAPDAVLDTLTLDSRDVSFDVHTRRINSVGSTTFTGTIGQENLTQYVRASHPGLRSLSVRLRASDVLVTLPIHVSTVQTDVTVSGTLAVDTTKPAHLDFIADGASVGMLPIPPRLVNAALRLVNPVFDLSNIRVPLSVTQAGVVSGHVLLSGTADLDHFRPS